MAKSTAESYAISRDEFDRATRQRALVEPKLAACRKKLYISSLTAIVMNYTGLVAEKISALGIEFQHFQQEKLVKIVGFIVLYFLIEFIVIVLKERLIIARAHQMQFEMAEFQRRHFGKSWMFLFRNFVGALISRLLDPVIYYLIPVIVGFNGVQVSFFDFKDIDCLKWLRIA